MTNRPHTYGILVRSSMAFPVECTENIIVGVRSKKLQTPRQTQIDENGDIDMGKATGFLEYERCENRAADVQARIRNFDEFRVGLDAAA